jgi:hypothetical protein
VKKKQQRKTKKLADEPFNGDVVLSWDREQHAARNVTDRGQTGGPFRHETHRTRDNRSDGDNEAGKEGHNDLVLFGPRDDGAALRRQLEARKKQRDKERDESSAAFTIQLKLNLELDIQLKANIYGDLTLSVL